MVDIDGADVARHFQRGIEAEGALRPAAIGAERGGAGLEALGIAGHGIADA